MHTITCLISLRRLSQSLIIILMLISPLSFSTDKITNFTYECPVSTGCSIKSNRRIALQRQFIDLPHFITAEPETRHNPPAPLAVVITLHTCLIHSRAPPV